MREPLLNAITVLLCAALLPLGTAAQPSPFTLEVEAGAVWQGRNRVEIPNDGSASRFSLDDLTGGGPWASARAYLTWNISARHGLRLLAAPLSVTESGVPTRALSFEGQTYAAGTPTTATYTFNSYRLTYRYRIREDEDLRAWIGLTAKVRDATVALEQGSTASRKDDLGFVPLLHFSGVWSFAPAWSIAFDADALAGGPGRAVDAALELGRDLGESWVLQLGYRTVEGGADVPEVYNFAWLHYAVASLIWRP